MRGRHIARVAAALLAAAALPPPCAWAHAFLDHAEPRVGSTLHGSPSAVTLTFTEAIEAGFSRIEVLDARDQRIESGPLEHPNPEVLRVALPSLPSGEYTVHWTVTSVDTHQTDGRFNFTVTPP